MADRYVPTKAARQLLGVSASTLRIWADSQKIGSVRSPGGQRLYNVQGYLNARGQAASQHSVAVPATSRLSICYCRVSSPGQRDDLERQVAFMSQRFPHHRIIRDVGSGINFKRRGLLQILELAQRGAVEELVVAHRDRLCRFAFDLVEWLLRARGVRLVVLDANHETNPGAELAEDLMAIVHVFSCRANGKRKYVKAAKLDLESRSQAPEAVP